MIDGQSSPKVEIPSKSEKDARFVYQICKDLFFSNCLFLAYAGSNGELNLLLKIFWPHLISAGPAKR